MVRCKKIALCPLRFLVNFKWFLFIYTLFYSYNRKFLTKVGFSVKKYITKKYWNKVVNVLLYYRREFLSYFIYLSLFKNLEKLFLLFCYVGYKGNSLNYSFSFLTLKIMKTLNFGRKKPKSNPSWCQDGSNTSTTFTEAATTPVWPTKQTEIEHKSQISYYYYLQMLVEHIH